MKSLRSHDFKAMSDMTRCLACRMKFMSDDDRSNVYNDDGCIGAIHDYCYPYLGGPPERAPITRPADVSKDRKLVLVGVAD